MIFFPGNVVEMFPNFRVQMFWCPSFSQLAHADDIHRSNE